MAHGCNLGLHTTESLTDGVTYSQLKRISDWQITREAQREALAKVADGIASLDIAVHWGEGKTSSSDGQRFSYPRKKLQQSYSTKLQDFALEFYSFIADNYAPFYSLPIECQERDGGYVLDGLLYNESDLDLDEHYTDTHGYTESGKRRVDWTFEEFTEALDLLPEVLDNLVRQIKKVQHAEG